ncbi:DUF2971 domain-containing protein [Tabrizicola sp.]|uniref:DUF2971 domain-containing protein n=1 Tax=Tabrizicola sp. TaxID=2005166 RepID=UPI0035B10E08
MGSFDINSFDDPPPPPKHLFKYLSVARIQNVLEQGTVRFTPLMNTNDSFEIRSTFKKFAGPRFLKMLGEQMDIATSEANFEAMLVEKMKEFGIDGVHPQAIIQMIEAQQGGDFLQLLRIQIQGTIDTVMLPLLNDPQYAQQLLEDFGRNLLCFSLSERADSAPMWAHYADNHQGFVVAFDTDHEWFKQRKDGKKNRLQKVIYFDGMVEEPLENVSASFMSKTTDWTYEREWRLYAQVDQVDAIYGSDDDPVHVVNFPADAVQRVIVGSKATPETIESIKSVLKKKYPHAGLTKSTPNRSTTSFDEVEVQGGQTA